MLTVGRLTSILEKLDPQAHVAVATWSADGGGYWFVQENANGQRAEKIPAAHGGGKAVLIGHFDYCKAHNAKHTFGF